MLAFSNVFVPEWDTDSEPCRPCSNKVSKVPLKNVCVA